MTPGSLPLLRTLPTGKDDHGIDIYIGRAATAPAWAHFDRGGNGTFQNPILRGEYCKACRNYHASYESTIPCFRLYFLHRVETDPAFRERVLSLRGKVLGCWCRDPATCHGSVMIAWIEAQPTPVEVIETLQESA